MSGAYYYLKDGGWEGNTEALTDGIMSKIDAYTASKDARISELEGDLVSQQIELQKMYGVDYQNERLRAGIQAVADDILYCLQWRLVDSKIGTNLRGQISNLLNPSNVGKETNEG